MLQGESPLTLTLILTLTPTLAPSPTPILPRTLPVGTAFVGADIPLLAPSPPSCCPLPEEHPNTSPTTCLVAARGAEASCPSPSLRGVRRCWGHGAGHQIPARKGSSPL